MPVLDLLRTRLGRQQLSASSLPIAARTPAGLVAWFGAVQAQDYAGAKWGLGQRLDGATDAALDRAFDAGAIVRTHVLRPTWHVVAPSDLRWLLALTGPRVHQANARLYRTLDLDARVLARSRAVLERALAGGRALTRDQLAAQLAAAKLPLTGVRLAFVLMHAELDAIICSGPRAGRQFTYMLVDDRVPAAPPRDRDDALAELVRRFFASHGPATPRDFAWWSGLTVRDAARGLDALGRGVTRHDRDGTAYWIAEGAAPRTLRSPAAWLLPNYDEFLVAYQHRALSAPADGTRSRADGFPHTLVVDGRIAGAWRRDLARGEVRVEVAPLGRPSAAVRAAVARAAARYARFLGLSLRLR